MTQIIIGLGHKARQGKGTFVDAVKNYYDALRETQRKHGLKTASPTVQGIGFADSLYEVCRKEYGMTEKDAPLLQDVGATKRNQNGENFWFDQGVKKIDPTAGVVIFSDVRYLNEADGLKKLGAHIVDVKRYDELGKRLIASDRPSNHQSEIELDDYAFDSILCNMHGHISLFQEQAITLVHYLRAMAAK